MRANAADFDTGGDWTLRWDNTIRTTLGLRLLAPNPALLANPNGDDGDRAFASGINSERVDVLSELSVSHGDFGFDASADGWYDAAYHGRNANNSPATFNPVSVAHDQFPKDVQALQGDTAELGTAYLHDKFAVWGIPLTLRVGRQTLLWGESLFSTSNGIAAGQAPVDVIKALSQPLATAKELFLPVTQIVGSLQVTSQLNVEAYFQPEWRRDRLPGVASYFSTVDFLDVGGERLLDGSSALDRTRDRTPGGAGQFGAALQASSGGADFGFYALRFDAKSPEIFVTPGTYGLIYPTGIELYGASTSFYVGDNNVAAEISFRRHMPLNSRLLLPSAPGDTGQTGEAPYAAGDTLHGQMSMISVLPPGRLWQGASLEAEITANERLAVTRDPAFLAAGLDCFAAGFRAAFTPQYFEVLPHLEVSFPMGIGLNVIGNSSVAGSGQAHAGDLDFGIGFTYRTVWEAGINYTHYLGSAGHQPLEDRDFVEITVTRSF